MNFQGAAYDGPLEGCIICADTNGNLGCDGGEPSDTTDATGGYSIGLNDNQWTAMQTESTAGLLVLPSATCRDIHTGLEQRFALRGGKGATSVNPLSSLPAALTGSASSPGTPSAASRQSRNAVPSGRRLQSGYDYHMQQVRNNLWINQTYLLSTIDLTAYNAYEAVRTGRDYCMASALIVRGAQTQSTVLQVGTVRSQLDSAATIPSVADQVLGQMASIVTADGFPSFGDANSILSSQLLTGPSQAQRNAIASAMANSYYLLEGTMPECPALNPWQTEVLSQHNTRRAQHCSPPLTWDASLAEEADAWARTCPSGMDSHSATDINENVVISAAPIGPYEQVVQNLFSEWYAQEQNYANQNGYATANGPCTTSAGVGFNYSTSSAAGSECVPKTPATRVTEFTQLLWRGHETVGCGFSLCSFDRYTLVCKYSRRNCVGAACNGNVANQFRTNVPPVNPSSIGPGPCTQRAWNSVIDASVASYVTQSFVPTQIENLLAGSLSLAEFTAATTATALADQMQSAEAQGIPILVSYPSPPPLSPTLSPPSPAPLPPTGISDAQAAQTTEQSDDSDLAWVWGVVFGVCLPLVLLVAGAIVLYRISGGEPGIWATVHYTHGNPKYAFRYATAEEREKAAGDLVIYQLAMSTAMRKHKYTVTGYWNMRRDHLNFIKEGGLQTARDKMPAYDPPAAEEEQEEPTAPQRLLPDEPSIDADLDLEFAESPEDRARRLEWIKYFVREGDLQRAFDLGWDGKPFRQAAVVRSPKEGVAGLVGAVKGSKAAAEPSDDAAGATEGGKKPAASSEGEAGASEAGTSTLHRI
jgi:hypothetical protein